MTALKAFGLIGYPLSHSFSKGYFAQKFEKESILGCTYENYPLEKIEDFPELINTHPNIKGLNVTIPYKEKIIPFLYDLDPVAKQIQAVNTIKVVQGRLIGYNTDVVGFESSLKDFLRGKTISKALILGTGGASKAVKFVLDQMKIETYYVSSKKDTSHLAYLDLNGYLKDFKLIINTTPLGMSPNTDEFPPIPYEELTSNFFLFDLIYNPPMTKFLEFGKNVGGQVKNGLQMLELQAEAAWKIWNE